MPLTSFSDPMNFGINEATLANLSVIVIIINEVYDNDSLDSKREIMPRVESYSLFNGNLNSSIRLNLLFSYYLFIIYAMNSNQLGKMVGKWGRNRRILATPFGKEIERWNNSSQP